MAVATEQLIEVRHPLVQHKLSYLRDKATPTVHFRKLVNELTLGFGRFNFLFTQGEANPEFPNVPPFDFSTIDVVLP